jgi:hypothetical protein
VAIGDVDARGHVHVTGETVEKFGPERHFLVYEGLT